MGTLHRSAIHYLANLAHTQPLWTTRLSTRNYCNLSWPHCHHISRIAHHGSSRGMASGLTASSARYCGRRRGFLQLPCIQISTSAGMLPCTAAASGVACTGMMKWYFWAHTGWCCQPEQSQILARSDAMIWV